jgi:hypothetical protein
MRGPNRSIRGETGWGAPGVDVIDSGGRQQFGAIAPRQGIELQRDRMHRPWWDLPGVDRRGAAPQSVSSSRAAVNGEATRSLDFDGAIPLGRYTPSPRNVAKSVFALEAPLFLLFLQEIISDGPLFPAGILGLKPCSDRNNSRLLRLIEHVLRKAQKSLSAYVAKIARDQKSVNERGAPVGCLGHAKISAGRFLRRVACRASDSSRHPAVNREI